ncbi:MAG: HAMP domain-containing sensor histidine kinase [Thermoleophilia bacterium]
MGGTLNAMLDSQERAAGRQRQFIDDASHELRTPLAALSAEIELALRKPRQAGEYEATLHRLGQGVERLTGLAETLLAIGALDGSAPREQVVAVREAVAAAAGRALAQLPAHRALTTHVPDDLRVHADPRLLDLALGNLVDNAVRHGDGEVGIRATDGPRAVSILVHDAGPGIPPEFLPHATERFRRAEASRSGRGTGLGLALAEGVAQAHGGHLHVCSGTTHHHTATGAMRDEPCRHPGTGTTVTLLLPVSPR